MFPRDSEEVFQKRLYRQRMSNGAVAIDYQSQFLKTLILYKTHIAKTILYSITNKSILRKNEIKSRDGE